MKQASKFLAAVIGFGTEALNLGYVPAHDQHIVTVVVGILTALAVYIVPNAPKVVK